MKNLFENFDPNVSDCDLWNNQEMAQTVYNLNHEK